MCVEACFTWERPTYQWHWVWLMALDTHWEDAFSM